MCKHSKGYPHSKIIICCIIIVYLRVAFYFLLPSLRTNSNMRDMMIQIATKDYCVSYIRTLNRMYGCCVIDENIYYLDTYGNIAHLICTICSKIYRKWSVSYIHLCLICFCRRLSSYSYRPEHGQRRAHFNNTICLQANRLYNNIFNES